MGRVAEAVAAIARASTPTEEIVAGIWAAELRLPHIGLDEDFIDLGSHSLQGVAVVARLEDRFGVSIPVRVLFEEPTVADLAAWIDRQAGETHGAEVEMIRLQEGVDLRPIFAVPGGRAVSRTLYALAKLARETDPSRPVYAFPGDPPVPANTPKELWVQVAAGSLNAAILEQQRQGPYLLLGSCVGGIIAWEMARQLEMSGEIVHLFLVDTKHPRLRTEVEPSSRSRERTRRQSRKGINRRVFRRIVREASTTRDVMESPSLVHNRLRRSANTGIDRRILKETLVPGDLEETADEMPADGNLRLEMTSVYSPEALRGRVRLITNDNWRQSHPTLGWGEFVGDSRDVAVMGKEHGLLRNVGEAAAWLCAQLDEVDTRLQTSTLAERQPLPATTAGEFH